jgi:hypothetical protein
VRGRVPTMRRKRSKTSTTVFHLLPVASFMGNEYMNMIFMSPSCNPDEFVPTRAWRAWGTYPLSHQKI